MKYIVEVNAKWLVSIEAETALQAEHKILEYNGIWGALAFDNKSIKTDTFLGAVQGCEMISMAELLRMVDELMIAKKQAVETKIAEEEAKEKLAKIEEMLQEAKNAYVNAHNNAHHAKEKYDDLEYVLGKQRI